MPVADLGRISLAYADIGTGDPPLLLIHELGGSGKSFRALTAHLAGRRRLLAPDLRGAGESEKPPGAFTLEDTAEDLVLLLDQLGVARVDVLGTALGSFIAAALARRHPRRVRRLVLCAVAPDIAPNAAAYLTERANLVRTHGMRAAVNASLDNSFPDAHAAIRAAYRPYWLANDPAAYAELSLALALHSPTPAAWAALTQPALVLSGAGDFLWPPPAGRATAELIPAASFGVLEQAGHFPHLQDPAALASAALDFLAG
jgi:3-oxoadipate enol-lactonase